MLPAYDAKVLVMNTDSDEALGFDTLALGRIPTGTRAVHAAAASLICEWWSHLSEQGQDRWELAYGTRFFSERSAARCASEIWPSEEAGDWF